MTILLYAAYDVGLLGVLLNELSVRRMTVIDRVLSTGVFGVQWVGEEKRDQDSMLSSS